VEIYHHLEQFQKLILEQHNMAQIRNEIYDDNGLVRVEFIEVEDINTEDLIKEKEAELLRIYNEIQNIKNEQTTI
jgi:hypothetical protein